MLNSLSKQELAELSSITSDAVFLHGFIRRFVSHKSFSDNSISVLIFGIIPFISLFIYETSEYFQRHSNIGIKINDNRSHRIITLNSRVRAKLFCDKRKNIPDQISYLEKIISYWNKWMNENHKGGLAYLLTYLQPDLSVVTLKKHIVATSFAGFYYAGLDQEILEDISPDNIGTLIMEFSQESSQFITSFVQSLGIEQGVDRNSEFDADITSQLKSIDEISNRFFKRIFNGQELASLNISLLLLLTSVNYVLYVLPLFSSFSAETAVKIRFLTLYHVAESLNKLQNHHYSKSTLASISKLYFRKILENRELRRLVSNRNFRNSLVHYDFSKIPEISIQTGEYLNGRVEFFYNEISFSEFNTVLDRQLLRMSHELENWMNMKE